MIIYNKLNGLEKDVIYDQHIQKAELVIERCSPLRKDWNINDCLKEIELIFEDLEEWLNERETHKYITLDECFEALAEQSLTDEDKKIVLDTMQKQFDELAKMHNTLILMTHETKHEYQKRLIKAHKSREELK